MSEEDDPLLGNQCVEKHHNRMGLVTTCMQVRVLRTCYRGRGTRKGLYELYERVLAELVLAMLACVNGYARTSPTSSGKVYIGSLMGNW